MGEGREPGQKNHGQMKMNEIAENEVPLDRC